jgi:chloramphenicol 3-O phosphotransferase
VIVINGPSASGKSSIQKKIQENFDEPYLALGIDSLFDNPLPDYYGLKGVHPKGSFAEKDIRYIEVEKIDGQNSIKLYIGPIGRKVISGMHYSIAAYAKQGNNVVVDYISYEKDWPRELEKALSGVQVYYIGIKYPLEIIEARESKRATSPVGHARSHFTSVHEGFKYDLIIDDHELSAEKISLLIKEIVVKREKRI